MSRKTTPTHVLLNQVTLAASSSSVTFSSIPQIYGDLVLVTDHTVSVAANKLVTFNGDGGSNYPWVYMGGNGSNAVSGTNTSTSLLVEALAAGSATERLLTIVNIMDYSATDKHKTALVRNGRGSQGTDAIASRWASISPIVTISIGLNNNASFAIGSTFSLYGVIA